MGSSDYGVKLSRASYEDLAHRRRTSSISYYSLLLLINRILPKIGRTYLLSRDILAMA
jgi:hypothetical protein